MMKLINVSTIQVEEFPEDRVPKYAILSHRWGEEEVSYQDMSLPDISRNKGYAKIVETCRLARHTFVADAHLEYVWVDTCCIDKTNSADIAEAINSMFRWYEESVVCYAWLSDLDPTVSIEVGLRECTWFTRGWTLQELLAPKTLFFYDGSWKKIGCKETLGPLLSTITKIDEEVLSKKRILSMVSAAERMSWASRRKTTKIEDIAYCLLGIFGVNMPLIYGEGPKAFIRLQEEIIKETDDMSLFAWTPLNEDVAPRGIFARSPKEFHSCRGIVQASFAAENDSFTFTSKGLQVNTHLIEYPHLDRESSSDNLACSRLVLDLNCYQLGMDSVGIFLRKYGRNLFLRDLSRGVLCYYKLCQTNIKRTAQTIHIPRDISFPRDQYLDIRLRFSIHLKVEDGLEILEAVPAELWDPSFQVFLPDFRGSHDRCIAVVLRPSHLKDSTEDIAIIFVGTAFLMGFYNFYQIPYQDPKTNYILENLASLTDLDLQNPPLGLLQIQQIQSGPPPHFFGGATQLDYGALLSTGEGTITLQSGEIRLRREIKEITDLRLPVNTEIDCVTISYMSNIEIGGDHGIDGERAETEESPFFKYKSRVTLAEVLRSSGSRKTTASGS